MSIYWILLWIDVWNWGKKNKLIENRENFKTFFSLWTWVSLTQHKKLHINQTSLQIYTIYIAPYEMYQFFQSMNFDVFRINLRISIFHLFTCNLHWICRPSILLFFPYFGYGMQIRLSCLSIAIHLSSSKVSCFSCSSSFQIECKCRARHFQPTHTN